jgi:hypothetical protein
MIRRASIASLLLLAACVDTGHFYGDEFSGHYRRPAASTTTRRVERREILHWTNRPADKKRVGYLYKFETQVAGSRETRESYEIWDRTGTEAIGFVTAEGAFYRYNAQGRLGTRIGEYPLYDPKAQVYLPTGLKVFFGFDIRDNVDLVPIDPYKF